MAGLNQKKQPWDQLLNKLDKTLAVSETFEVQVVQINKSPILGKITNGFFHTGKTLYAKINRILHIFLGALVQG